MCEPDILMEDKANIAIPHEGECMMQMYDKNSYCCIPLCHYKVSSTLGENFGMVDSSSIHPQTYGVQVVSSEWDRLLDLSLYEYDEVYETTYFITYTIERIPFNDFESQFLVS